MDSPYAGRRPAPVEASEVPDRVRHLACACGDPRGRKKNFSTTSTLREPLQSESARAFDDAVRGLANAPVPPDDVDTSDDGNTEDGAQPEDAPAAGGEADLEDAPPQLATSDPEYEQKGTALVYRHHDWYPLVNRLWKRDRNADTKCMQTRACTDE